MTKFLHSSRFPSFYLSQPISYHRYLSYQEVARNERKESILFLEHSPSLTGGVSAKAENLLVTEESLAERGVELVRIQRGGDFTAHEPGQIVGYPHIDLRQREIRLGDYLQKLTYSIRNAVLEIWNVELVENREAPGLYLADSPEKKMVSIGVLAKSYFTSFGFALNGVNDLSTFRLINPCGMSAGNMVSLSGLGKVKDWEKERLRFAGAFLFHLDKLLG
ncbi:lipoyl(octanoyl) transferase LipB [Leptospira kobayashii]|uniref:lipoyl(octanoyl) transferase LipB n=1 Tax=Leptospira kobayashii TaxID=1917830 RepID=UPI000D59486F|nr:lipoyl(octanoyl) transferase LipB [Leptospira kobayashii]